MNQFQNKTAINPVTNQKLNPDDRVDALNALRRKVGRLIGSDAVVIQEINQEAEEAVIEAETITVSLIPQQVKAVVQSKAVEQRHEEIATAMLKTAAVALSFAKLTSYEGDLYKLELKGQTLSITAKDGRGLLVSSQGDRPVIHSPPTEADLIHFREQRQRLDQAAAQAEAKKRNSR